MAISDGGSSTRRMTASDVKRLAQRREVGDVVQLEIDGESLRPLAEAFDRDGMFAPWSAITRVICDSVPGASSVVRSSV